MFPVLFKINIIIIIQLVKKLYKGKTIRVYVKTNDISLRQPKNYFYPLSAAL